MITEILHEVAKEFVGYPVRMIAEIVQFLILIAIVWMVAFGIGKRRGFVANMLTERMGHVQEQVHEAQGANAQLDDATNAARDREAAAAEEAERLVAEARAAAAKSEEQVRAEADAEATRIVERARMALVNETAQMQADLREQLVEYVSQASRSIMNEKLTVAEQRTRIEGAIVSGVATAGKAAPEVAKRPHRTRAAAASSKSE